MPPSFSRVLVLLDYGHLLLVSVAPDVHVAVLEVAVLDDEILDHDLPLAVLPLQRIARVGRGLRRLRRRGRRLSLLASIVGASLPAWVLAS